MHDETLERLAFIEQLSGAPPTHCVVAQRDGRVLYQGRLASCELVKDAFWRDLVQGDDSVGPVEVQPLADERTNPPAGSDPAGASLEHN